ncbi:MAG TPA: saccharopine dehydrogenase C-terminal domain-containing protein [Candidatus Binatia bacterium]|nr:saccharopine dehydrogenase C-terminal domain-containing protein [Candidatus Binatia bacterium]
MRILIIGAGGVGSAVLPIAARRNFFEQIVVADYDPTRARRAVDRVADARFVAIPRRVDAADRAGIEALIRETRATHVLNAVDPRFVMPIFEAALAGGADYLDMAMSLSRPHPERPYELPGVKLGDEQFARAADWEVAGRLALVGIGVEPGLSDVFARYAADELFAEIDEIGVRDGANLVVEGYAFAPSFSIWTTIEECLNPPVVWERDRGWYTTPPFSEPETFVFPEGIGPVECVNVEHEEVLLIPRWIDAGRVTFKYGLGAEFIEVLQVLHKVGLDRTEPVRVGGVEVSPRDVVAACLPDPATLGDRMRGKTCAGTWVRGRGKDGRPREVYLYHVVDNAESMARDGAQAVVWQTAINPVVALELLATGVWQGAGVLGPEAFPPRPFLDLLVEYGSPWGLREG